MTLTDLLDELGVPYKRGGEHGHVSHGWTGLDCPFCSPGWGHYRLGVNARGAATCWTCGPHALVEALAEAAGQNYAYVRSLVARLDRVPDVGADDRPRGKLALPAGLGPLLPVHRAYLEARGFDPDALAEVWGVQGVGLAARLAWRLFFPVTRRGKVVTWTTRATAAGVEAKYVNARPEQEAVPIKQTLYGADHCRHGVVVVEGPLDAVRVGPGAVAVYGLAYTQAQVLRLSKFPVRAVCFDSEPQAQAKARRLCDQLSVYPGRTVRVCLDAADPGSAPAQEIKRLRRAFLD